MWSSNYILGPLVALNKSYSRTMVFLLPFYKLLTIGDQWLYMAYTCMEMVDTLMACIQVISIWMHILTISAHSQKPSYKLEIHFKWKKLFITDNDLLSDQRQSSNLLLLSMIWIICALLDSQFNKLSTQKCMKTFNLNNI